MENDNRAAASIKPNCVNRTSALSIPINTIADIQT